MDDQTTGNEDIKTLKTYAYTIDETKCKYIPQDSEVKVKLSLFKFHERNISIDLLISFDY